jgi:hypothetical protein
MKPLQPPPQEETHVERASTPNPYQMDEEMSPGAWIPHTVTPDGEPDIEGKKRQNHKGKENSLQLQSIPICFSLL